jgi:hypothetical protein
MADDHVATTDDQFDKLARVLGHLIIAFNGLEVALGGALMYLLKQDEEVGAAFVAHISAATKIHLLQDLEGRIKNESSRSEFREMVKQAEEINTERNRYIHSEYWPVSAAEQLTVMLHRPLRDSNKPVDYPITISALSNKYVKAANEEEIMDLADEAAALAMRTIRAHLAPALLIPDGGLWAY